jgi:Subtilase family/Secretion system C-terminal sorting domain
MIVGVGDYNPNAAILDDAILYAAQQGADIITMSLVVGSSSAIDAAIQSVYNTYGTFIDCATGNNDNSSVLYPANNPYVFAVGATSQSDQRVSSSEWGSNYGSDLDVVAPGVEIWSTRKNNGYGEGDGTSYATPQIAGIASLLLSKNSNYSNQDIWEIISSSAEKVGGYTYSTNGSKTYATWNNEMGYGRVSAFYAIAPPAVPTNFSVGGSTGQNPVLTWTANTEPDLNGYKIYVKYGTGNYGFLTSVDKNTTSFTDPGVTIGGGKFATQVCYKITSFDVANNESDYALPKCVSASSLNKSGLLADNSTTPVAFKLYASTPNPFNPSTVIRFDLPKESNVKIEIFNLQGKLVREITNRIYQASSSKIVFNGTGLTSGIYIYKLTAIETESGKSFTDVKRMTLIK